MDSRLNRVAAVATAPIRFGAAALATTGRALSIGASMLFARGKGWALLLSRTRIDYRAEIGDPSTNSAVGAVVGWISRNFPEAPVRIVREGTTEPAYTPSATGPGAMLRLLERPNAYYSGVLQWMATMVDWTCAGDAYWIKTRYPETAGFPLAGRVNGLWWVPQRLMEPRWPEQDNSVFIGWYEYNVEGVRYRLDPSDVVHFRNGIDPSNPRKGRSPLASLFREIFTDDEAANFTASLLRNLGVPGVVIAPSNTSGSLSRVDPESVKTKFMEKFSGDKRGEPLVLTSPTDVKVLSFNPQEMDLKNLRRIPEERIAAVLGVPAGVAQLGAGLDRNTFSNYGEANVAAYTQGVIPGQRLIAAEIEVQLLPDFADIDREALDVWFDWSKASAMQALADAVWKRFESAATKGLLMRSAFLNAIGRSPATDGSDDVYILPNNYVLLDREQTVVAGGSPPPGGRPPTPPNGNGRPASALEIPGTEIVAMATSSEVRCSGCGWLLAEQAAAPYRFTCRKCKTVTASQQTASPVSA